MADLIKLPGEYRDVYLNPAEIAAVVPLSGDNRVKVYVAGVSLVVNLSPAEFLQALRSSPQSSDSAR